MVTAKKNLRAGVYIDGSNLFWAMKIMRDDDRWRSSEAWRIDFRRLKNYFKRRYDPDFYNYYGVTADRPTTPEHARSAAAQKRFYASLNRMGYRVVTKPLKYITQDDGAVKTKGDMDIELTMGIVEALDDIDLIILVSGDSDYLDAIQRFHSQEKYIRIYSFGHVLSWELKDFAIKSPRCSYHLLENLKDDLTMQ